MPQKPLQRVPKSTALAIFFLFARPRRLLHFLLELTLYLIEVLRFLVIAHQTLLQRIERIHGGDKIVGNQAPTTVKHISQTPRDISDPTWFGMLKLIILIAELVNVFDNAWNKFLNRLDEILHDLMSAFRNALGHLVKLFLVIERDWFVCRVH